MFRLNNHYCTELINYEPRRIYESGRVVAREYNVSALYEGHVDSLYVCMYVCMSVCMTYVQTNCYVNYGAWHVYETTSLAYVIQTTREF